MRKNFAGTTLLRRFAFAGAIALMTTQLAHAQLQSVLFSEDFESLAGSFGQSVNERWGRTLDTIVATTPNSDAIPNAFSHVGPAGWAIDNNFDGYGASVGNVGVPELGNPEYGVDEWEGWSFASKDFWVTAAGDQDRSLFTNASGNVAVADGDEWDDLQVNPDVRQGFMNTNLTTAPIDVAAHQGQTLNFKFDSSWRPEAFDDDHLNPAFNNKNNQAAVVRVRFDDGTEAYPTFWDSNSGGGSYKPDTQNETIAFDINVPATATSAQVSFGYYNAANDWWWAIDNLSLTDSGSNIVWSENFDAVPLGDSVNERIVRDHVTVEESTPETDPFPNAFTKTTPTGWGIDNSLGLPGIGDPAVGVEEWEGWSFTNSDFWLFVKDSQRSQFTDPATGKASGVFAVADPDNWDNLGDAESQGSFNSLLETPALDISSVPAGQLAISFDSSWRDEDAQLAQLEVDFGSGWQNVFTWSSDSADPNFKDDAPNESVFYLLNNPAGATTAKVRFGMLNATDDWWWAIDNVRIGAAVPEPTAALLACIGAIGIGLFGRRRND